MESSTLKVDGVKSHFNDQLLIANLQVGEEP